MASLAAAQDRRDRVRRGILLALLSFAMFTTMDTVAKTLLSHYPTQQVAFFQALFSLLPMLALTFWNGGLHRLRTRRLHLHMTRAVCTLVGINLAYSAFAVMPIADAYAILFTAPLIVTALSVPLLGETVGWRRWLAVLVGFMGVIVMLRPGSAEPSLGMLAALGSAATNALNVILVRRMQGTETSESFGVYGNLMVATAMLPLMLMVFEPPTLAHLGLSALGGLLGGTAFLFMLQAFRACDATVIVPFQYTQMVFGVIAGFVVFGDIPTSVTLFGAGLVMLSGLYILHRETMRRRERLG